MKKSILLVLIVLITACLMFALTVNGTEESYSIHDDLSEYEIKTGEDAIPLTLGTRFAVKVPGTITKVRMYVGENESGSYTVEIWDTVSEDLAAGPFFWNIEKGEAGWREFELENPLKIKEYNDYTIAVRNTTGSLSYQYIVGYYKEYSNDYFITHPESGVYQGDEGSMPVGTNLNTYPSFLRDVVFVPDEEIKAPKQDSALASKSTVYLSDLKLGNKYSNGSSVRVDETEESKGFLINSQSFIKGFMHRASSKEGQSFIEVNVEGLGFKTFAAYVGIPDLLLQNSSKGSIEFIVSVDGKEVARSEVKKSLENAVLITADITDGKVITLSLSDGGDGAIGDYAVWGNAIVTKNSNIDEAFNEVVAVTPTPEPTEQPTATPENTQNTPQTTNVDNTAKPNDDDKPNVFPYIIAAVVVVVVVVIVFISLKRKK